LHKTRDIGDRRMEGYALTGLGNALAGLGSVPEAADAFEQAITLRRELGEDHLATESLAGLARLKLAQGIRLGALECVETILAHLPGVAAWTTRGAVAHPISPVPGIGAAGDRRPWPSWRRPIRCCSSERQPCQGPAIPGGSKYLVTGEIDAQRLLVSSSCHPGQVRQDRLHTL